MARPVSTAFETAASAMLPATYAQYIDRTREALHARLGHAPAGDLLRQYFERGKMLRAFLVFAATSAVGGDPQNVIPAAEAIELLHGASLFHDDIIDNAPERRGIASLHERLGVGPALVLGDDLLLRAFMVLSEARANHPAARVLDAMEALNQLARECCRGQFDELCASRWISEEEYLAIISGKTAAPFVASGVVGVLFGGGAKAQENQIRTYARHIGIALQIEDDLLDLTGEPGGRGKPVGNSLAQGRPMLPLIYLWEIGSSYMREQLPRLDEGIWTREELVKHLESYKIIDRVRDVQRRHLEEAIGALKGFRGAAGVDALRELAARVSARAMPTAQPHQPQPHQKMTRAAGERY